MPEIPDLTLYQSHLERRIKSAPLLELKLPSPFVLRTVEPSVDALVNRRVSGVSRLAKQLVISFESDLHLVIHLMISGRLHWRAPDDNKSARNLIAQLRFATGKVQFTEASKKKRASLRVVDSDGLLALDPGGLEVFKVDAHQFTQRLQDSGHTLKRALTDQRVIAGIGNAYSDEILLHAGMSPFKRAAQMSTLEGARLHASARSVLADWSSRLADQCGDQFPKKVTAFHEEMLAHGKYRQPCGVCGAPIQRIRYADNEANYCASCQTDGKIFADRSLSRLLKGNWPKRLEDLEG